jgi:hypothetical protein
MKHYITLALVVFAILISSIAYADQPAPLSDFAQVSINQQFVFVLLARDDDSSAYNQLGYVEQDAKLRQKYQQSGLYRNDGSTMPLWTVDWNAYQVDVSSDGRHLVRWGPWPWKGDFSELALVFYEDGRELQQYRVYDLVAQPADLPESVSHYQWLKEATFDDAANTVTVRTLNSERYVFDIRTGKLVSGTLPPRRWTPELIAAIVLGCLGISALLGYRWLYQSRFP